MHKQPDTRKHRREREKYAPVLTKLVNMYIEARASNDPDVKYFLEHRFNNLKNAWKDFVHKWNKNPKHVTELKESDFEDYINERLNNEKES